MGFRAGDIVSVTLGGNSPEDPIETDEWQIACDEEDRKIMPSTPVDICIDASLATMVKPASDETRITVLKWVADVLRKEMRGRIAQRQLDETQSNQLKLL